MSIKELKNITGNIKKIKNNSGIKMDLIVISPSNKILARGESKTATVVTSKDNRIFYGTTEDIDQKILDENLEYEDEFI